MRPSHSSPSDRGPRLVGARRRRRRPRGHVRQLCVFRHTKSIRQRCWRRGGLANRDRPQLGPTDQRGTTEGPPRDQRGTTEGAGRHGGTASHCLQRLTRYAGRLETARRRLARPGGKLTEPYTVAGGVMSQRDGRTERRYETARRRRTGLKAIRGVFNQQYGSRREPCDIASWW